VVICIKERHVPSPRQRAPSKAPPPDALQEWRDLSPSFRRVKRKRASSSRHANERYACNAAEQRNRCAIHNAMHLRGRLSNPPPPVARVLALTVNDAGSRPPVHRRARGGVRVERSCARIISATST